MYLQSARWFVRNWRDSDDPVVRKVQQAFRNNLRKVRTASDCCGNHGEPGC